ncbi:hypothetical protein BJY00DRAFT_178062 [Aspergillus carlsbadensis]|nr:hypothetical protein BJY00DRAFT_178062 [Aspergillus carlsbadensis]
MVESSLKQQERFCRRRVEIRGKSDPAGTGSACETCDAAAAASVASRVDRASIRKMGGIQAASEGPLCIFSQLFAHFSSQRGVLRIRLEPHGTSTEAWLAEKGSGHLLPASQGDPIAENCSRYLLNSGAARGRGNGLLTAEHPAEPCEDATCTL